MSEESRSNYHFSGVNAGTDPGFPVGGGANPRGAPTYDFAKISEKLHEIEKDWGRRGGRAWRVPPS